MRAWVVSCSVMLGLGCAADAPAHDVRATSDCNGGGVVRVGEFHFPDTDFQTHCSGGILTGTCSTNWAEGRQTGGDLRIVRFRLTGLEEFGPSRYELDVERPPGDVDMSPYGFRDIECYWHRDDEEPKFDEVGETTKCFFSNDACTATLEIL